MKNQTTTRSPNGRRGTILVFVLGVLVMLFLIGTAVIVSTRGERQNVAHLAVAANEDALMEQAVNAVLQVLRRDIWGDDTVALNSDGGDEPWDAPGPDPSDPNLGDVWLAATIPYRHDNGTPGVRADDYFVWPRVSYGASNVRVSDLGFDADGDGVFDSVRSNAITVLDPATTGVGVAVRIIDNASMVNVQTGYDEGTYVTRGYPRRGRWLTDIVLNDPRKMLVDPADAAGDMTKLFDKDGLFPLYATDDPLAYWQVYVRTDLLQFPPMYDASEEAALRHRFGLVRYFGQDFPGYAEWFLRHSCLWPATSLPGVRDDPAWATTYANNVHWWMFDYAHEDGNDPMHWQNRIVEDDRPDLDLPTDYFVRRLLLTTASKEVLWRAPAAGGVGAPLPNLVYFNGVGSDMSDPGLFEGNEMPTLNFYGTDNAEKARSLAQLAWCFFYSGLKIPHPQTTDRAWMAWQLALNVLDYRDDDDVPSMLTSDPAGTIPYAFGLERQPFLTEAYAKVAMKLIDPNDAGSGYELDPANSRYAVEIFNPWWNDTDRPLVFAESDFRIVVDPPGTETSTIALIALPDGLEGTNYGGFSVVASDAGITGNLNQINPAFAISKGDVVSLQRQIPSGSGNWVTIDRIDPGGRKRLTAPLNREFAEQDTTSGQTNEVSLQRDKEGNTGDVVAPTWPTEWQFTVAREGWVEDNHGLAQGPSDDDVNYADSVVAPCPWIFRNDAAAADLMPSQTNPSFDSVGELSRVLAYGPYGNLPAGEFKVSAPMAVSSEMLNIDTAVDNDPNVLPAVKDTVKKELKSATGRVNFFYDENDPAKDTKGRTLFRYISTLTAAADDIDNNGDGKTDYLLDPNEAAEAKYQIVHGRLNINTAPRDALYAVPFMFDDRTTVPAGPGWDMAAAIVADREQRPIYDLFGTRVAGGTKGDPFRSVGSLARLSAGVATPYNVDRFAQDFIDLPGNLTAPAPWSPEFIDYSSNANKPAITAVDDVRERDILLARWGNLLTVRSDVFTCYILLVDGAGKPIRRAELLIDRTNCFGNAEALPNVLYRVDTPYTDTTR